MEISDEDYDILANDVENWEKNHTIRIDETDDFIDSPDSSEPSESESSILDSISPNNISNNISNNIKGHIIYNICEEIREFWKQNYVIKNIEPINNILAVTLSHAFPDDPIWILLVAQSSSLKTELLRSLGEEETDKIFPVSRITKNAIMPGSGTGLSLGTMAGGKILVIKDLTTILESRKDDLSTIASGLREIYDGYTGVISPMEKGSYTRKDKITLIAGVTPDAIDNAKLFKTDLGERLIYTRFPDWQIIDNDKIKLEIGEQTNKRDKIKLLTNKFLDIIFQTRLKFIQKQVQTPTYLIDTEFFEYIKGLTNLITTIRREVYWNTYNSTITNISHTEGPHRLRNQLYKMSTMLTIIKGKTKMDNDILNNIIQIGLDSTPNKRIMVLIQFFEQGLYIQIPSTTIKGISNEYIIAKLEHNMVHTQIRKNLCELEALRIINKIKHSNGKYIYWKLNDKFIIENKKILNKIIKR